MAAWDQTHGKARGGYLKAGASELYVRQVLGADGLPTGRWKMFVDGRLEGQADREATARAAAELVYGRGRRSRRDNTRTGRGARRIGSAGVASFLAPIYRPRM